MQAYLAGYARWFGLPVQLDTRIEVVEPADGGRFHARTTRGTIRARHVVIATGPFSSPRLPAAADGLDAGVPSCTLRGTSDLSTSPPVTSWSSAAATARRSWPESLPPPTASPSLRRDHSGPSPRTSWGSASTGGSTSPASSTPAPTPGSAATSDSAVMRSSDVNSSGWWPTAPSAYCSTGSSSQGATLTLEDGTRLRPSTVLWCTGFRPDYPWLRVPGALWADGSLATRLGRHRFRACTGWGCRGRPG